VCAIADTVDRTLYERSLLILFISSK